MKNLTWLLLPAFLLTACSHTYYVVRHAEKAGGAASMSNSNMTSPGDVPLSEAGNLRAGALRDSLKDKSIGAIYCTNTIRTRSTAQPTADYFKLNIIIYGPRPDSAFIRQLKKLKKNVLIVGHSNTVDDIVNGLTGTNSVKGDLADPEYDDLFMITQKGKSIKFTRKKYGANSE